MNNLAGFFSTFGRGPAYPVRLDSSNSRIVISRDEATVRESIAQIIGTDISERPYLLKDGQPYGTRVRRLLFSGVDAARTAAQFDVERALSTWEPRITNIYVTTAVSNTGNGGAKLLINVSFRYRASNRSDNLVYPFVIP